MVAATGAKAAPSPTGGAFASFPPVVESVSCRSDCAGLHTAREGSVVRVSGERLDTATRVVFAGRGGTAGDVAAEPIVARQGFVEARVPAGARSGPVLVVNSDGAESSPSRALVAVEPAQMQKQLRVAAAPDVELEVGARRVYLGGDRKATLTYMLRGAAPIEVTVELVRTADGALVRSWPVRAVAPGAPQTVTWDGTADGEVQPEGRYEFRIVAGGAAGALAAGATREGAEEDAAGGSFLFLRHMFPVRGKHDYGELAASFGGGRGHEGHDVFAACGTPVVAARGGVVRLNSFHGAAGNYVVVDGDRTGDDYVYMHLRDPGLQAEGERVRTGELLGYVGATGRASGCHLHFELWSAPGWYSGGAPYDPLPDLRQWDARS